MSVMKQKYATIAESTLDFYVSELQEAHRLLDTVGIPRDDYSEPLSISQRVALLVNQYAHATD